MFSWITGPRITNGSDDVPDPILEQTFIEPPDTPAPQFAIKAFKQALFGTPAPEERSTTKKLEKRAKTDTTNGKSLDFPAPKENGPAPSPTKLPGGILMTPGTAKKGKSVTFGAHVVDNEGKKVSRSGIPNNCPGKFPSPWTPGTELKEDLGSETKPRTKLTQALYNARTTPQLKSGEKPKARDDSDISLDLGAPRSESGKYWKEQYDMYADRSEKEMRKLVTKQQLAKNYAKKKDAEAIEAMNRLAEERKRFRNRERELEQQNKDYQERLRQAMADKTAASIEIAALKSRLAKSETAAAVPKEEPGQDKESQSLNNPDKPTATRPTNVVDQPAVVLGKPVRPSGFNPEDKENSPPKKLRHMRRQTLPDTSLRVAASFSAADKPSNTFVEQETSTIAPQAPEQVQKTPLSNRRPQPSKENLLPKSPAANILSSPLPQPSPDPWMDFGNSPAPTVDRMAMPIGIGGGPSYSRPTRPAVSRHRASKSAASAARTETREPDSHALKIEDKAVKSEDSNGDALRQRFAALNDKRPDVEKSTLAPEEPSYVAKSGVYQSEGQSHIAKSRIGNALPVDRREEAKRRLMERKARKQKMAAA